ncbi:MAG: type III pantothenate kinase [Deltaproteobacteria bacterium]|nr:type III pantothenate kinase [Deltaproteobacteria bacterium]MCB9787766.1 type III pantothenate kinase [Deltaproteobacteria bacterium]
MLMVIDVGNTNTVLGVYDGEELIEHWRVATNAQSTTDELGVLYMSLFAARRIPPEQVGAAIVACVVPPAVHAITRACDRYFDVHPLFVGADVDCGMPIAYDNPREVGADRLVNAVAAYARWKTACVVVDFGTATTFDVIGAEGVYRGGVIAPGIGISLDALFLRASKLPRVNIARPERVIGTRTVDSMQAGIVFGYVGLVDGLVERIREEMPEDDVRVIATGGLAALISSETRHIHSVEPFLTLEGLRLIHERHRQTLEADGEPVPPPP